MLNRLINIGFRGRFLNLLLDCFTNRYQILKMNDVKPQTIHMQYRLPHDSTLSQMLFNICLSDINLLHLGSNLCRYADDTVVILPHTDIVMAPFDLQKDTNKIIKCLSRNEIFLNADKTTFLCFRNPHKQEITTKIFPYTQKSAISVYILP